MVSIFQGLLFFNRFFMLPIRFLIFIGFALLAFFCINKNKKTKFYNIIVLINVVIILVADFFGSEGSIISFIDCITGNAESFLLLFLTCVYSFLLLSNFVFAAISMLLNDIKIKKLFILINVLITTFVAYLAGLFFNDILYLMGEVYETGNANDVIFPLLLRYSFIPIIGIVVFIILFIIFKKKKTN